MGVLSFLTKRGGRFAAPRIGKIAPGFTAGFLQKVLDRAVSGTGPFDSAATVADKALADAKGDVDEAVDALVSSHTRLAGAQGFLTNIGGLVTAVVTVPANVTGLVMVELRLHAAIAKVHGLDLADPGVRAAVLVTLLGHDETEKLVRKKELPGNAAWLAGGGDHGQETIQRVSAQVAATLVGFLGGKQLASMIGKRVPLFGGVVGAATDARATRRLGRDAARDLPRG
ncbi:EcsC family protein [Nocardioides sp.]|uniref:EcsC family protein n=1 Tax=Nocardioides sp. TaxID=35761 RepID=UPI002725AD34|nr:EcsC family protein [Nocardioides sp.]MDO9456454.1 EcsC family protein [Nocardioides sp.]